MSVTVIGDDNKADGWRRRSERPPRLLMERTASSFVDSDPNKSVFRFPEVKPYRRELAENGAGAQGFMQCLTYKVGNICHAGEVTPLCDCEIDPVKKKYKQALKISEIADYLQDLEDCSEEDLNDIEVAILPPDEVDEVTDIEEGPDDDMGVIPVSDVAGQVEFSCTIDQTIYKRAAGGAGGGPTVGKLRHPLAYGRQQNNKAISKSRVRRTAVGRVAPAHLIHPFRPFALVLDTCRSSKRPEDVSTALEYIVRVLQLFKTLQSRVEMTTEMVTRVFKDLSVSRIQRLDYYTHQTDGGER
ncbi:hypothetical protein EVAR_39857_1 [Eumeta japonica]|uniref:Uncharacterized protein n=1 Tax=Eumeta variegata TaxID=151549 RepID=A0A4C1WRX2_EUMVA|nr:hypothetical protein EVAR_39857_1 [Eumeta japonica]